MWVGSPAKRSGAAFLAAPLSGQVQPAFMLSAIVSWHVGPGVALTNSQTPDIAAG